MWILKDDINDNNNNNLSLLNKNINIENSFKDNIFLKVDLILKNILLIKKLIMGII